MNEAKGHAVRATYFYTAMADVALLQHSAAHQQAVDRIWANAIHKKYYLTGGVGASHQGEAFAGDFELPNDGYCESCASCGLSFWSDRMHRLDQDAAYRDVQERVLYNNLLGCDRTRRRQLFLSKPARTPSQARYPWHGCPCCVGNIPRTLFAIKDLHVFRQPVAHRAVPESFRGQRSHASRHRRRRRCGSGRRPGTRGTATVTITLHPSRATEFALRIRIPNRTESELYTADPISPAGSPSA